MGCDVSGKPKGRRAAIWAGVASLLTIAATATIYHDRLYEEWLIHKLGRGSPDERSDAARALGRRRSVPAIPYLKRAGTNAAWDALLEIANISSTQIGLSVNELHLGGKTAEQLLEILGAPSETRTCDFKPPLNLTGTQLLESDEQWIYDDGSREHKVIWFKSRVVILAVCEWSDW